LGVEVVNISAYDALPPAPPGLVFSAITDGEFIRKLLIELQAPDYLIEHFENPRNLSNNQTYWLYFSQLAAGVRYFLLNRVALHLRSGYKLAFAGWPSQFFWSVGLTLDL